MGERSATSEPAYAVLADPNGTQCSESATWLSDARREEFCKGALPFSGKN